MGALIREAAGDDLDALHALIERAYRGEEARGGWTHEADLLGGQRTSRAALSEGIADPCRRLLTAEEGGQLIGCVEVTDKGGDLAYLGLLTVDPTRQAGGLGKALLTVAETAAREHFGTRRMEMTVVEARHTLIAYYQRRGYAVTGEMRKFPAVEGIVFLVGTAPAMTVLEKMLD